MNIGIKFCGGCNPNYDRGDLYRRLLGDHPEHSFEMADETKKHDLLIVICGCKRACANVSRYSYERKIMVSEDVVPEIGV